MDSEGGPVDVLRYHTDDGPVYRTIEAGRGEAVVGAHERELRKRRLLRYLIAGAVALASAGYGALADSLLLGVAGGALFVGVVSVTGADDEELVPKLVEQDIDRRDAERRYEIEGD
ncbi:hypothetical protein ACFQMA_12985 [Halosimplex aquaticum]|uniref:Uncharacterized protein n=1 Tax=Halosimplex aquaticum TaxID=3026162 RepID=A0ABD5Y1D0_9EURY|nr:hypothetical protein [Halosimplex aquaticum]